MSESAKIYQCKLCKQVFDKHNSYWYHRTQLKKCCMTKEQVLKIIETNKHLQNECTFYQEELETQRKEKEELERKLKEVEHVRNSPPQIFEEATLAEILKSLKKDVDSLKRSRPDPETGSRLLSSFILFLNDNNYYDFFADLFSSSPVVYNTIQKAIKYMNSHKRYVPNKMKRQVQSDQEHKCNVCSELLTATSEIDHIIPLFMGGSNLRNNLQALCQSCHSKKTLEESIGLYEKCCLFRNYLLRNEESDDNPKCTIEENDELAV